MCPGPLFTYNMQPGVASRSKRAQWWTTLAWARKYRALLTPRSFAALLATKAAMKARRQRDWAGFLQLGWIIVREGRPSLTDAVTLFGAALMPLRLSDRVRSHSFAVSYGGAPGRTGRTDCPQAKALTTRPPTQERRATP